MEMFEKTKPWFGIYFFIEQLKTQIDVIPRIRLKHVFPK